jgi:hypothetical protein
MVSTIRYIPRGYVDSEAALLRIAKTRHPARWRVESMNEKEAEIYSGLGSLYNAEILGDLLRFSVPASNEAEIRAIAERLFDFEDAAYDLRIALHAGEVVAEFVDENGRFGSVKSQGWGGDTALSILLRGVVWLHDVAGQNVSRLVLFKIDHIDRFAKSRKKAGPRARFSKAAAERGFKEWRQSRGDEIPSVLEDCRYMKSTFDVGRDFVRELRKTSTNATRGRPKKS